MSEVDLKEMLEAGVHFGHKKDKWNPKMRSFIFTERNGIHIFDLIKTKEKIESAQKFAAKLASEGKTVLFVGTKKQVQGVVKEAAEKAGMPYLTERWPGGMLTNFSTILVRLKYLKEAEEKEVAGKSVTKKEALNLKRELAKLNEIFEGVKDMRKVPDALFVADIVKEHTAVREAKKLGIPIIGIVDTNANPDIEYLIPANDDAVRSVQYISEKIAETIAQNKKTVAETVEAHSTDSTHSIITQGGEPVRQAQDKQSRTTSSLRANAQDETTRSIGTQGEDKKPKKATEKTEKEDEKKKAEPEIVDETEKKLEKLEMKAEEEVVVKKSKPKEE